MVPCPLSRPRKRNPPGTGTRSDWRNPCRRNAQAPPHKPEGALPHRCNRFRRRTAPHSRLGFPQDTSFQVLTHTGHAPKHRRHTHNQPHTAHQPRTHCPLGTQNPAPQSTASCLSPHPHTRIQLGKLFPQCWRTFLGNNFRAQPCKAWPQPVQSPGLLASR